MGRNKTPLERQVLAVYTAVFSLGLMGCAAPKMDLREDASRLTGLENAIVFRDRFDIFTAFSPEDRVLSPARSVRLALAHDPRIQAALARVRMAEADSHQARLLPNPILTIDIRYAIQPANTAFEPSLSADLLSLLQKPAQISAADSRLRAAASTALSTVLDVIDEVEEAYASARSIDLQIENSRRREDRLKRLRIIAQQRLEGGDATRLDVQTVEAQLMQAELEIADFTLQRVDQRLTLNRLLGYPRLDADWELAPWNLPEAGSLARESAWIDTALANRPEIQAKLWELRALGDELRGASIPPIQGGEIGAHAEHDPEWRLGPVVAVPLPIFDFGQAAREKLRAERAATRYDLAQLELEVIQNARSAYATYLHARESLSAAQDKLLPLQRRQLDSSELAYRAGEADLATLLLSQNEYELILSKIVALQEQVTVSRAKLMRAVGGAGVGAHLIVASTQPTTRSSRPDSQRFIKEEPTTSRPATGSSR